MIKTHYRGFTLVDLLVTLAIIAIVTAVASPRYFNSLSRYKANAAAHRVAADIALTQRFAKSASSSKTISYDSANNRYKISGMTKLDNSGDSYLVDLQDPPYQAELGLIDLGGDWAVVFDGFGMPDSGGFITVQAGDVSFKIVLDADTGATSIE